MAGAEECAPIKLPQLIELCLIYLALDTTHDLLSCLLIPSCKRLTIKSLGDANTPAVVFDSATRHMELAVQSILASVSEMKISLDRTVMAIDGKAGGMELHLTLPMLPYSGSAGWFEPALKSAPASATTTLLHCPPSDPGEPFPLLHHTSITTLEVRRSVSEAARWVKNLSAPTMADGLLMWPLPKLRALIVDNWAEDAGDLMKTIRDRYGKGSATDVSVDGNPEDSGVGAGGIVTEAEE